ncbi:MAG: septal ring lytic transglycosylase RlpA family protein [Microcystaceae cyanobacterium]
MIFALVTLLLPTPAFAQTATYYGNHFSGRPMANGKPYNPNQLVAAHPRYPIGTRLRVTNRKTGKSVVVTVSDRCSCSLDLSRAAFKQIGNIKKGRVPVSVSRL